MKKVKQLFLVCAMAFMLCGCYKANINITVHSDGTADMAMEILVSEEAMGYMGTTVDDLKESITQSMSEEVKNYTKVKEISRTYDDEKYVGLEMSYDLEKVKSDELKKIIKIKDDTITFSMDANDVSDLSSDQLTENNLSMDGVEFNMNVTMPGKILENNIGEVEGNTVKINLLTFTESKIVIKSELGENNTVLIIVGVVAAVAVIAGVAFFLIKKNKKKDDDSSEDLRPIDPNASVTTTEETKTDVNNTEEIESTEVINAVDEVSIEAESNTDTTEKNTYTNENEEKNEDSTEN